MNGCAKKGEKKAEKRAEKKGEKKKGKSVAKAYSAQLKKAKSGKKRCPTCGRPL